MANVKKSMFNRLKKKMPELNKECLKYFVKWFEAREQLKKTLNTRELSIEELNSFKQLCLDFSVFGDKHIKEFNDNKIQFKVMEKYLLSDVKYCDKELIIKKSIDLTFEKDLNNIKKEVEKKK